MGYKTKVSIHNSHVDEIEAQFENVDKLKANFETLYYRDISAVIKEHEKHTIHYYDSKKKCYLVKGMFDEEIYEFRALPEGWIKRQVDKSGKIEYFHKETNKIRSNIPMRHRNEQYQALKP